MLQIRLITFLILLSLGCSVVYAKNEKHKPLPPGLEKKAQRGQALPPGWQKKLAKGEILDHEVYRHASIVTPLDSHGLITIRVEGKLIRLIQASREIIDILE